MHAGPVEAEVRPERFLDRRDSDCMLRGGSGKRDKSKAFVQEPFETADDEQLLDALMRDTIKVLVDC